MKKGRPLTTPYSVMMGHSFDTTLGHNLTWWRNAVLEQDMDFACFVDGKEGSGKSLTVNGFSVVIVLTSITIVSGI